MKKIITHFFDCKPLTLNQAFITLRNGRRARSSKYELFKKTIEKRLNLIELEDFSDTFNQSKHALKMTMIVYLKDLYTKKGTISQKSGDIDNFTKCINDIIFKNTNLDDSYITELHISKNQGDKDCFLLTYEIISK